MSRICVWIHGSVWCDHGQARTMDLCRVPCNTCYTPRDQAKPVTRVPPVFAGPLPRCDLRVSVPPADRIVDWASGYRRGISIHVHVAFCIFLWITASAACCNVVANVRGNARCHTEDNVGFVVLHGQKYLPDNRVDYSMRRGYSLRQGRYQVRQNSGVK